MEIPSVVLCCGDPPHGMHAFSIIAAPVVSAVLSHYVLLPLHRAATATRQRLQFYISDAVFLLFNFASVHVLFLMLGISPERFPIISTPFILLHISLWFMTVRLLNCARISDSYIRGVALCLVVPFTYLFGFFGLVAVVHCAFVGSIIFSISYLSVLLMFLAACRTGCEWVVASNAYEIRGTYSRAKK